MTTQARAVSAIHCRYLHVRSYEPSVIFIAKHSSLPGTPSSRQWKRTTMASRPVPSQRFAHRRLASCAPPARSNAGLVRRRARSVSRRMNGHCNTMNADWRAALRLAARRGQRERARFCRQPAGPLLALVRVGHVLIKRCDKEQKQDGEKLRKRAMQSARKIANELIPTPSRRDK